MTNKKGVLGIHRNNYYQDRKEHVVRTPIMLSDFLAELSCQFLKSKKVDIPFVFDPASSDGRLLHPFKSKCNAKIFGVDILNNLDSENGLFDGFVNKNYFTTLVSELPDPNFVVCNPPWNHKNSIKQMYRKNSEEYSDFINTIKTSYETELIDFAYNNDGELVTCSKESKDKLKDVLGKAGYINYMSPELIDAYCFDFGKKVSSFSADSVLLPELFVWKVFNDFGYDIPSYFIVPHGFRLNIRSNSPRHIWLKNKCNITSIVSLPLNLFDGVLFHCEVLFFNTDRVLEAHYTF